MRFLCRVAGLTLHYRMGSSVIWKAHGIKPVTPLRGASCDVWEPSFGSALGRTNWEETLGIPRICRRDYIAQLSWEHLGIPKEEPVAGKKNTGLLCSPCWHRDPDKDKWLKNG